MVAFVLWMILLNFCRPGFGLVCTVAPVSAAASMRVSASCELPDASERARNHRQSGDST